MLNIHGDINRHPFAYLVLLVAGSPRRSTRSISRRRPGRYRFHILRQDAATTSRHSYRRLRNFHRGSDPTPDAQVTDAGLVHLKGMTKLERLYLAGTKVTTTGVADLKKALPNCRIRK